jgi:hypothetical protein
MFRLLKKKMAVDMNLIQLSPDVRASLQGDGVVFLHTQNGVVFRSNRVGAAIWKGLSDRKAIASIAEEIGREHGIPFQQAAEDASRFVAQLEAEGFLSVGRRQ